jgi:hypothetical protein
MMKERVEDIQHLDLAPTVELGLHQLPLMQPVVMEAVAVAVHQLVSVAEEADLLAQEAQALVELFIFIQSKTL